MITNMKVITKDNKRRVKNKKNLSITTKNRGQSIVDAAQILGGTYWDNWLHHFVGFYEARDTRKKKIASRTRRLLDDDNNFSGECRSVRVCSQWKDRLSYWVFIHSNDGHLRFVLEMSIFVSTVRNIALRRRVRKKLSTITCLIPPFSLLASSRSRGDRRSK